MINVGNSINKIKQKLISLKADLQSKEKQKIGLLATQESQTHTLREAGAWGSGDS